MSTASPTIVSRGVWTRTRRPSVSASSRQAGRTLAEVSFPAGTLVISGEDGSQILKPETTLTPGSQYVVAVEPGVVAEVLQLMRG